MFLKFLLRVTLTVVVVAFQALMLPALYGQTTLPGSRESSSYSYFIDGEGDESNEIEGIAIGPDQFLDTDEETIDSVVEFELSPEEIRELMKPKFEWSTEQIAASEGFQFSSYGGKVTVPTYPIFGGIPPFLSASFEYFDWDVPDTVDLPSSLYQAELTASLIRPLENGWTLRFMLSGVFASDNENTSSQAWQLRGGGFAMIPYNDRWSFVVGALATGRNDVPVIPAAGAIWTPSEFVRVDLIMPQPKISYLFRDGIERQQWVYFASGFGGGNWAYETSNAIDDELTYREWRAVVGWEAAPKKLPGQMMARGRKLVAEGGIVFGRKLEFESMRPQIDLGESAVFRLVYSH